jgi:hypothetical protein
MFWLQFHRRTMKPEAALMISRCLASALLITAQGTTTVAAQTAAGCRRSRVHDI